jgi:hypothetical protein
MKMKIKPWEKLFAPEDDDLFGDGGSGEDNDDIFGSSDYDEPNTDTVDDDDPPAGSDDDDEPSKGTAFSPEDISKAIIDGFSKIQATPTIPTKQPELSKEELAKRMNVWDPSDDEANGIASALTDPDLTPAERKAALKRITDGISKQVLTEAGYHFQAELAKRDALLQQVMPVITAQAQRQSQKEFYGEYPGLKPFGPVVETAAREIAGEYQQGGHADVKDVKKLIAERTLKLIRSVRKDAPDSIIRKQPKGSAPRPAATTSSGNSGRATTPQGVKGRAADIW